MLPGFDPGWGLWGLGLYSFLAATLLPGGSEIALFALIRHEPELTWAALSVATTGNTLGGLCSWLCGRLLPARLNSRAEQLLPSLRRYGAPLLLFSWLPLAGDLICVAAGWLRLPWLPCTLFMAIGKFARYWLISQGAQIY